MDAPSPPDAPTTSAAYRVLARKYRPQSFDALIGQEPMVRTLTNAFESGRIAQAFLLTGVRGVGKTTTARILARALNYTRAGVDRPSIDFTEPGEHCLAIMEGRHVDVIEMDAASHTGISDIREIIEAVRYKPAIARFKVYIIDEVHMLSNQAFNGLLKTLEEPPEHVKFVFATTEIRKVPVTVLSRCQRFDLRRIDADRLVGLLGDITARESIKAEPAALAMIARAAEGSARDSLSLLDQAIAHAGAEGVTADEVRAMLGLADGGRIIDLFEQAMRGDATAALATLETLHKAGADPVVVLQDLANFAHLVTRLKVAADAASDPAITEEERVRGTAFAGALSLRALSLAWQMLLKGIEETKLAARPQAAADMVLVRIAYAADLPAPDDAVRQLRQGGGSLTGAVPTAPPTNGAGHGTATSGAAPTMRRTEPVTMASGRGAATARAETAPAGETASALQPEPAGPRLDRFEDLVALATQKRDLKMMHGLEHHVRLIRFEHGRIEFEPAGDMPQGFTGELDKRLREWTGTRWGVSVGRGPAAPTLAEQKQSARDKLVSDAQNDPLVLAVLRQFPGAEIVDVRIRDAELKPEPAPADMGLFDPEDPGVSDFDDR
ncbi:MAG: DNA polymerase III subunit gamma/tau [Bauldia sp.]|nr:DNA polymerase III subunit gamma/tau [Bauldia sp.]